MSKDEKILDSETIQISETKMNDKEEPIKCNPFKLKDEEKKSSYTIQFSSESNSLLVDVSEDESIPSVRYKATFSLNDLEDLSSFFKMFETTEALLFELNDYADQKKIKLKKDESGIILEINLGRKRINDPQLKIPKVEDDPKILIGELCDSVNRLNKQIMKDNITDETVKKNLKKDIMNDEEKVIIEEWILKAVGFDEGETFPKKITKNKGQDRPKQDKKVHMKLLYSIKEHGDSASTFHSKCDSQGSILILIMNSKGYRCGGFFQKGLTSSGNYINDPKAFLFSLEYQEQYFNYEGYNAYYDYSSNGPSFGADDLIIVDKCTKNYSHCNFPYSYKGNRIKSLSGGYYYFRVEAMEVYKIEIDAKK